MKFQLIFYFQIFGLFTLSAQDYIILKNSDTIKCKIIEDKISFLTYKLDIKDSTLLSINVNEFNFYVKNDITNNFNDKTSVYKLDTNKYKILGQKLKRGGYMSYEEFINNNPSVDFSFKAIKRSDFSIAMFGGNKYRISTLDAKVSNQKIKYEFWGVCDGKDCYINCKKISNFRNYAILTFENECAYFYAIGWLTGVQKQKQMETNLIIGVLIGGAVGGAISGAASSSSNNVLYKVDFKKGEVDLYINDNN